MMKIIDAMNRKKNSLNHLSEGPLRIMTASFFQKKRDMYFTRR